MRDEEQFLLDLVGGGGNEDGKGMKIEKVNVVEYRSGGGDEPVVFVYKLEVLVEEVTLVTEDRRSEGVFLI